MQEQPRYRALAQRCATLTLILASASILTSGLALRTLSVQGYNLDSSKSHQKVQMVKRWSYKILYYNAVHTLVSSFFAYLATMAMGAMLHNDEYTRCVIWYGVGLLVAAMLACLALTRGASYQFLGIEGTAAPEYQLEAMDATHDEASLKQEAAKVDIETGLAQLAV